MRFGRLRHFGLPIAVVLLCLGLLVFGLMRLYAIEKTMRINQAANMLWVISQTEVEVLRLEATLARHASDDVLIAAHFDLLVSRLSQIAEGPQLRHLEMIGFAEPVLSYRASVLALDPLVSSLTPERADLLVAALDGLRQVLHRAGNRTMVAEWESISARLEGYRSAVAQVILSLVLGIAFAAYLGWRLVADQRDLLRAQAVKLRSIRLEKDLQQERTQGAYWRDFAAVVSHQFRTPLAVIDSCAQRIVRRQKPGEDAELLARVETIRKTVAGLSKLVEAALLAGQIDNGIQTPNCARRDLVGLLRLLIADLRTRHPGRSLRLEAAQEPLLAWLDEDLALHAVMDLVENALRHSTGPVVLRVFVHEERVGCAVIDCGPGIPTEELPRIFERFQRGTQTTAEGTGLGLWIARKLAELQSGSVEVESWLGCGSVFTLWLRVMGPAEKAA